MTAVTRGDVNHRTVHEAGHLYSSLDLTRYCNATRGGPVVFAGPPLVGLLCVGRVRPRLG